MCKVLNKYKDSIPVGAIYIGRPSKWGNPFIIGKDGTREEVLKKFEEYVENRPNFIKEIKEELKGKDLICFCAPKACHGSILLKIANEKDEETS